MKLKEAVCVLEHLAAEFNGAEYITNAIYKVLDKLDERKDCLEVLDACLDFQAEEIEELSDSNINLNRKLIKNDGLTTANLNLVAEVTALSRELDTAYANVNSHKSKIDNLITENAELIKKFYAGCEANSKLVEHNRVLSNRAKIVGNNYKILYDRLFNQAIELAKERNELLETCKGHNS